MATERLQIVLDAAWRGKAAVKQAKSDIGGIDGAATKSGLSLGKLAAVAGTATVAIGATAAAAKVAWDTMERAAAIERTVQQFDNLAQSIDTTADSLLGNLRTATRGMMTDAELMQSAGQIMSLGLADTEEGVSRLASVVGQLGWDMNQVILTFANNSTMRLDALGLSIQDVTSRARELEAQGLDADKAFDLAVIEAGEEKIRLLGDASETTRGKIDILEASWRGTFESMLSSAGAALSPVVTHFADMVVAANNAESAVRSLASSISEMSPAEIEVQINIVRNAINEQGNFLGASGTPLSPVQTVRTRDAFRDMTVELLRNADAGEAWEDVLENYGYTISATGADLDGMGLSWVELTKAVDAANKAFERESRQNRADMRRDNAQAAREEAQAMRQLADTPLVAWPEYTPGVLAAAAAHDTLRDSLLDYTPIIEDYSVSSYNAMMRNAELKAKIIELNEAVEAGEMTAFEAAQEYRNFADSLTDAVSAVDDLRMRLEQLPDTVTINFDVVMPELPEVVRPGGFQNAEGGNIPGFARGGSFVVPPGYPNDSYLMAVTSDEHVEVTPRGQQRNNTGGNITINNYDRQSAALNATIIGLHRRAAILS